MLDLWLQDLESLEAISQDDETCDLFLRMATLSQEGRLDPFLAELARDDDLDEQTKGSLAEIARDRAFLFALEDYVVRTRFAH